MSCPWPFFCNLFGSSAPLDPDLADAVTSTLIQRLVDTDLTVKAIRAHLEKLVATAVRCGARAKELEVHTEAIHKRLDEFMELSQSAVHTIQCLSDEVSLLCGPQAPSPCSQPCSPTISKGALYLQEPLPAPNIRDQYCFAAVIGQGSCAQVFRATALHTGQEYAIKVVDRKIVGEKAWRVATQEAKVLRQLHHPHIVDLVECVERGGVMYMVMELLVGGDLFEKLVRLRQYSEQVAARLTRNVLSAVQYMHEMGIVHRDIKPENVMLRENTSDGQAADMERLANVTLIDFGFARYCAPGTSTLTDCCGTIEYIAPEILLCWMGQRPGYGHACDMWSIGIMTFKLLSGTLPFTANQEEQTMMKVLKGRFEFRQGTVWERISDQAKSFISELLVLDPTQRMTAQKALAHPWIAQCETLPSEPLETQLSACPASVRLLRALPNAQKNLMIKTRVPTGDIKQCHVGDVLPLQIYAMANDVPMPTALQFLASEDSRCCPVVDRSGHFLGFFHVRQVLQLVVHRCQQQMKSGHCLEVGRRAELSGILASKEQQVMTFGKPVAEVLDMAWPPPTPPFTLHSNLLDVIRKGFLSPGPDGTYADRVPLLTSCPSAATAVMVVQADGSVRSDLHKGPYIAGVVTSLNILQLLYAQPAILGPGLWGSSLEELGLLSKRAWAVPGTMSAVLAFHVMLEERAPGIAILDDQARIQWSLSESDFLGITPRSLPTLALPVEHFLQAQAKVRTRSTSPPAMCDGRCTLGDAIEMMVTTRASCLYIVNSHQRPISVITHTEILEVVAQHTATYIASVPSSPLNDSVGSALSFAVACGGPEPSNGAVSSRSTSVLNESEAL